MKAHPYPWRSLCQRCGSALSKADAESPWVSESLTGRYELCERAPKGAEGEPGPHAPGVAVSISGPVGQPCDEAREQRCRLCDREMTADEFTGHNHPEYAGPWQR